MDRLQFVVLLTSALSSFVLVLLAWMHLNVRLTRIESFLRAADNTASSVTARTVGKHQVEMDRMVRSQSLDMEAIRDLLSAIHNHFVNFSNITARLEGRIDELSR